MTMPDHAPPRPPRLERLVQDIARRLRPVCSSMPREEFEAMVRTIAERTYRWETRLPELRPGPP
jgi:hypothetical protein